MILDTNDKTVQNCLIIAGSLSICVCTLTYCAKNWDNPPDWWTSCLQPSWNKKNNNLNDNIV